MSPWIPSNNVFVADYGNHTVRKLSPSGTNWVVTTIAGLAGSPGFAEGTNGNIRFYSPYGICADTGGNLYVADYDAENVRKLVPSGTNWVSSTLAGRVGVTGSTDGTGTNAFFNGPASLAVDGAGNVYVGDGNNYTIRKLTPGGTVSTLAGVAGQAGNMDGTGGTELFTRTWGVAVDTSGNLYVADYDNNSIRKGVLTSNLGPVMLRSLMLNSGLVSFGITGYTGLRADIQASAGNLTNWQTIGSYVLGNGTNSYLGVGNRQTNQFFRGKIP
jgi:hypothetical protein